MQDNPVHTIIKNIRYKQQLEEVARAASWLEEVDKLHCEMHPGLYVDKNIILQMWEDDPDRAWKYIREQRGSVELNQIKLQAWKDLQKALAEINMLA